MGSASVKSRFVTESVELSRSAEFAWVPEICACLAHLHPLGLQVLDTIHDTPQALQTQSHKNYVNFNVGFSMHVQQYMHAKANGSRLFKYVLTQQDDSFACLAHLPLISSLLFVTSAQGATSALACQDAAVFAVCDYATHSAVLYACRDRLAGTYMHFSAEEDKLDITAFEFCRNFLLPAAIIAMYLQKSMQPVVVHCLMGMNRSCTAICLAVILNDLPSEQEVKQLVRYIQNVNRNVRCEVLTNYTFVKYIVKFAAFARQQLGDANFANLVLQTSSDFTTELVAQQFGAFCQQTTS